MSAFWITWLKLTSAVLAMFGVLLVVADLPGIGLPARLFYDFAFLKFFEGSNLQWTQHFLAANGVLGAVTMALGLLLYHAAANLAANHPEILRRLILGTMPVWYVVDQFASLRAGAYGNMISNTAILLALIAPFLVKQPMRLQQATQQ